MYLMRNMNENNRKNEVYKCKSMSIIIVKQWKGCFFKMNQCNVHTRGGWSPEENDMLFREIEAASRSGRSVKSVFHKVAEQTGRQPNSIRNYYYLRMKENADLRRTVFVPFTEEEVDHLMRAMLRGQAEGRSVRGIAMELANSDQKNMLRYQNKYRSVIHGDPEYVRALMDSMRRNGERCADPYRKKKRELGQLLGELAENLSRCGVDSAALFGELLTLSAAAQRPDSEAILKELSEAKRENAVLREQYGALCAVSTSFLEKTPRERAAQLEDYVSQLSARISP